MKMLLSLMYLNSSCKNKNNTKYRKTPYPLLKYAASILTALVCIFGSSIPTYAALNFTFNAEDQSSVPGEGIQVEWIVTNEGTTQENNISVEVPFPTPGISSLSEFLTDGGDCPGSCDPGDTIVWALGNIPAGESRVASFPLFVSSTAADGSTNIEARLKQGASVLNTSTWVHQIQSTQVAELSIDSSQSLVAPGETFSYGLLAGNTGVDALSSAVLSASIPSQLAVVSAPGGAITGNTVSWSLGNLPSGRVTRRVVNVRVRPNIDVGELLVLDDAVLSGSSFGLPQSVVADHVISVGDSSLDFQIRAQESQFTPGESQTIEILVSNTANQTVQNATVSFLYPFNLSTVSETNLLGGDCPGSCDPGDRVSWDLGNLLPGEVRQIRFATLASSNSTSGVPVKWQGRLTADSEILAREYLATGNSDVDINLQIDADETQVSAGDVYHYTFSIGNTGIDSIVSTSLSVPVPDGVTVLDAFDGSLSGDTVTWTLNDLAAGAVSQKTLRVKADNNLASGSIINLIDAEVSATVFGIAQATMAQHMVAVSDVPLDMEVRLQQGVARNSESVLVEMVVSNTGNQVQQNVIAGLLFPDEISTASLANLESASCPGSCDSGDQMSVSFGNLVPGETKSVAHSVSVNNSALLGEHTTWVGNVSSDNSPSRRFESTLGISDVGLELLASSEQLLVNAGDTIVYQFASGNTAGFIAGNVQLTIPLPSEVSVVSSPGGQVVDDRVIYNLGDIEDEEILLRELTVMVDSGTPAGSQIVLENIELSGLYFGVEQLTHGSHIVAVGSSPLTGGITVEPEDPQPGDSVEVTIDISNDSSQVQQNIAARLRYPAGVSTIAEALTDGGDCPGSCSSGEDIVWSLGTLVPGATASISFLTTISSSEPLGDLIEWPARLQAGTTSQRRIEAYSLVGNVTLVPAEFCNGLEVTVDLNLGQTPGPGDDVVMGTSGNDDIRGRAGNDTICGMGGNDFIHGNSGDDWIDGGNGVDNIRGGQGSDNLYSGSGATVGTSSRVFGGTGDDSLFGGPDADDLRGGRGVDMLYGEQGADLLAGNEDDDVLYGGNGADTLKGGNGDEDQLFGEGGADSLNGGSGANDFCDGGGQTGDTDINCEIF